ncbi:MAG: hypothetical protein ACKO7A_12345, partial [Microcystis sp.]
MLAIVPSSSHKNDRTHSQETIALLIKKTIAIPHPKKRSPLLIPQKRSPLLIPKNDRHSHITQKRSPLLISKKRSPFPKNCSSKNDRPLLIPKNDLLSPSSKEIASPHSKKT